MLNNTVSDKRNTLREDMNRKFVDMELV